MRRVKANKQTLPFATTPVARLAAALALAACLLCLAGCQQTAVSVGSSASGASFAPSFTPASFDSSAATGTDKAAIDTSSCSKGYVAASGTSPTRMKIQVSHDSTSYNYDLPSDGTPCTYPLNMGDGDYTFTVFQNIEGTRYAQVYSASASVQLEDQAAPFLIPSFYCSYDERSACVAKARELTETAKNQADALAAIYNYIVQNITYDDDKAVALANVTGYTPDPDATLATKSGICFDYSSLAAAMLRSVGIPAKIITGNVEQANLYHAWNMVYIDGTWQTVGVSVKANAWSRIDTTFAADGFPGQTNGNPTYIDRYVY